MLTVNSEVKKIYGKTEGKIHSKTGVSPIEFNANNQGLISWSMLGNGQQTGTPSPQSIIMPDFCGVRTGNLTYSNATQTTGTILSISQTIGKSSFILNKAVTESSTSNFASVDIPLEAGTYTASVVGLNLFSETHDRIFIRASDDTIIAQNIQTGNPVTFTLSAPTTLSKIVIITAPQSIYNNTEIYFMLNLGFTALPYEPYGWAEKITCAGQTTSVYLGQTQTVRKIRKLVLTGEETYYDYTFSHEKSVYVSNVLDTNYTRAQGYCTHYPVYPETGNLSGTNYTTWIGVSSTQIFFIAACDVLSLENADAFKAWVAAQYAAGTPVTLWYVLATPQTGIVNEPLAKIGTYADELRSADAGVTIPTTNGANTISVDTTIPPSSLTIQYTSPDISEIVRAVDGQGKPLYGPRYGFKIDKSQTDSASAIIYTHDAVTMTPAYMDYTNGSFNYGSWGNVWFVKEAKPVALNLDGTIAYYLDPNDYTKKLDGTNSDIFYTLLSVEPSDWSTQWKQYYHLDNGEYVLNDDAEAPTFAANTYYKLETSFTGNFMVQFPKVYFKRYEDANYNYVEVSDRKLSRDFKAYAHLNANGDELDFIYLPMFKGVIQSSKLRSIPGVIPQGGTTASAEVTAAEACGTGWQIWDHSSREMLNDLLVLMSKNADSQAKFGKGREFGGNASDTVTYGKLQTGTLIKKGSFYGYSTSYSDVKVFHIEGSWANRWERLQGLLLVDGAYKIKMAPPYNFTGTDFVTLSTPSPTSNNYARTLATSELGSVTAAVSAHASSPFKDYFYQDQSGIRVGIVGGFCESGSRCGPRCVYLNCTASTSGWVIGASAIYK